MMAKRRFGIFRGRLAMHVGDRPQRRLGRWATIEQPGNFLIDWQGVERSQFGKNVVGMLMIDQRLSVIGFASLKKLGKSGMRRGQRLRRKHLPQQDHPRTQPMLLHGH